MRRAANIRTWGRIVLLGLAVSGFSALGQSRGPRYEEPRWLKLRITRIEAGLRFEADHDVSSYDGGADYTYSRYFIGPEIGLDMMGSVFHPNFCRFYLTSQGAFGNAWEESGSQSRETLDYLGRLRFTANLLNNKPYKLSLFTHTDHSYRDYDFFNQVTVDTFGYGARLSYDTGPWSFNGSYSHDNENVTGSVAPTTTVRDEFSFNGSHARELGTSSFDYHFNRYDFSGSDGYDSVNDSHTFGLSDYENFGSRKQFELSTRAGYLAQTTGTQPSSGQLTGGLDLTARHPHNLRSTYNLTADRYESGTLASTAYLASAGVHHQLYESLGSSLTLFAAGSDYADRFSDGYSQVYGVTWAESYKKRIGRDHQLRLDNSVTLNNTQSKGISTVEQEPHQFSSDPSNPYPDAFYLNQQYVNTATIRVENAVTGQVYTRDIDYEVIVNGSRTLVGRISIGGGIPDGTAVLVDYQCEPRPESDYGTFSDNFRIRLDLWSNLWGLYCGVSFARADAPEEIHAVDFTRLTLGTDVRAKWFSAGAEFERYYSDESEYESFGLFQSASLDMNQGSSLGAMLSQRWVNQITAGYTEEYYRFTVRYRQILSRNLSASINAGASYRTGNWDDETQLVFRPNLSYRYGSTTILAEYGLEHTTIGSSEERVASSLRISVSRKF